MRRMQISTASPVCGSMSCPARATAFGQIELGALFQPRRAGCRAFAGGLCDQAGRPVVCRPALSTASSKLRVALGETGFPFARLAEPELLIDHARTEGDLSLEVDPGGKYAFGSVVSGDPAFLSQPPP